MEMGCRRPEADGQWLHALATFHTLPSCPRPPVPDKELQSRQNHLAWARSVKRAHRGWGCPSSSGQSLLLFPSKKCITSNTCVTLHSRAGSRQFLVLISPDVSEALDAVINSHLPRILFSWLLGHHVCGFPSPSVATPSSPLAALLLFLISAPVPRPSLPIVHSSGVPYCLTA